MSNPDAEVDINEYMVACYGTTEYAEDMTNVTLTVTDGSVDKSIAYAYKCREEAMKGAKSAYAVIPEIETKVSLLCENGEANGYIKEGYAFSPMFTLGYTATLKDKEAFATWLKLEKAN